MLKPCNKGNTVAEDPECKAELIQGLTVYSLYVDGEMVSSWKRRGARIPDAIDRGQKKLDKMFPVLPAVAESVQKEEDARQTKS